MLRVTVTFIFFSIVQQGHNVTKKLREEIARDIGSHVTSKLSAMVHVTTVEPDFCRHLAFDLHVETALILPGRESSLSKCDKIKKDYLDGH